jgi:hypothetical protein
MVKRLPFFLLILSIPAAFAQLDSNSVTVSATRSMTQQPDQVLFAVTVQSGFNTSLEDVVAALQGSGITAANFSGVSLGPNVIFAAVGPQPVPPIMAPAMQWIFSLPAPLAKIKDTIATLTALQQSVAKQNNGLMLSFNVQGSQVSAQSQQSFVCPIPDLLADATTQAQKLASAAGLSLGSVLAMSSGTSISGSVGTPIAVAAVLSFAPPVLPSVCSMTVKFALLRFQ